MRSLVTGASSGIGEAFAYLLAKRGDHVILVARRRERLEDLAARLRKIYGVEADVLVADLSTSEGCGVVEGRLRSSESPIDLLVNDAGVGTSGPFLASDLDAELSEIALDVMAVVRLCHAAGSTMASRGRGAILNVASLAGFAPGPGMATYGASKAFVLRFSEALAEELRGSGVTVSCLCPGFTRTEFQASAGVGLPPMPRFVWQDAETVARAGLDAVEHGQVVAIPGWHNRLAVAGLRLVPASFARWAVGRTTLASRAAGRAGSVPTLDR